MDPAPEVLAACTTIGHCFMAAGMFVGGPPPVPSQALISLLNKMGAGVSAPSHLLAIAKDTDVDKLIDSWRIGDPTEQDPQAMREPTLMEMSMTRMAVRCARLHHKLEKPQEQAATEDPMVLLAEQVRALAESSAKPPEVPAPQVSLKETINQTSDGAAPRLTKDELIAAYRRYEEAFGPNIKPPEDEDHTPEQLAALKFLIESGEGCYVDFNLWVPHGYRLIRKQIAELCAAYQKNGNQMPANWPYDWQRPWNYIFSEILRSSQADWRYKELEYPALLLASARVTVGDVLGGDAQISRSAPASSPPGLDVHHTAVPDTIGAGAQRQSAGGVARANNPPPPHAEPRRPRQPRAHNVVNGAHVTSRSGYPLCSDFNSDAGCDVAIYGQWCPRRADTLHLCNRCLSSDHGVQHCRQTEATAAPRGPTGGGKGGKGAKGGKGGKGKGGRGKGQRRAPY